ncbi:EXLDI protein [Serinicoccus kebangsaanensis]|uniref:EXLDI protein n=1 Tax=Serinicoccus kebangsaanensis TaxID=2602069 RepID=UPI00124CFF97|nr:EXLDI protein [Serinicoccus kebangsaanensis]
MPNKTIYVSDADLAVFARAQELTGGNLSAAISTALHRLVDAEEGRLAGYQEISVPVGTGGARWRRFHGVLLVDWHSATGEGEEHYRVFRTRGGRYAVHVARSASYVHRAGKDGQLTGWRKHFATDQQWGEIPASAALDVYDTLDDLRAGVPADLAALVEEIPTEPEVEDLDI